MWIKSPNLSIIVKCVKNFSLGVRELITRKLSFAARIVRQNKYKFYMLTMPSDVLARTCYVTTREKNPLDGFQRYLDSNRAQEIAEYLDSGLGTVPTTIILSAQPEAKLEYNNTAKTLKFNDMKKSFLIIDGQHRVYGFHLASKVLRVPVVVYTNLTRKIESRLFIDINTKQKAVPNELLLDIKKLARYENESEKLLGDLFDLFNTESDSVLLGVLSPSKRAKGKISRVSFNVAFKTVGDLLSEVETVHSYEIFNSYLSVFIDGIEKKGVDFEKMTVPTFFATVIAFFPDVGTRLSDRFGNEYTEDNFTIILKPFFERISKNKLANPGNSRTALLEDFKRAYKSSFSLA